MHAVLNYLAAAVNRHPHAADRSADGSIIAFGSNKFVALWNPLDEDGIFETIPGHSGAVTCVQFVQDELVSGDDHGWLHLHQKKDEKWRTIFKINAHRRGISTIVGLEKTIITGSSDSTLKIWTHSTQPGEYRPEPQGSLAPPTIVERLSLAQEISIGKRFPISLSLAPLPGTSGHILAVGSTEPRIRIFVSGGSQFVEATVLPGHEDWVRALAFCPPGDDERQKPLTLASGSQDGTIRLWTITQAPVSEEPPPAVDKLDDQILDSFEAALGGMDNDEHGKQVSTKQHLIKVNGYAGKSHQFHITFDALLVGHDAGVTGVSWKPSLRRVLLSTSTDSSAILWSPTTVGHDSDNPTQLWTNHQRFGDVGGQRLGGFVSGFWINSDQIVAWTWNGGFRRWGIVDEAWQELQAVTGHASPVHGLDWEPAGRYLISASLDQTVRIHGPRGQKTEKRWLELARAQVHGYDCIDAKFLSDLRFASIADEKVTRVFDAPGTFVNLASNLGIRPEEGEGAEARPIAANVPPLGLSNKAVEKGASSFSVQSLHRPPFEAELASTTLWPEIEKIFGHGYELIALATSHSKKLIATACKATSLEHAVVRLVDTGTFKPFGPPLAGHTLTVTRISFNHNDRLVLAVGKDRTWHLFEKAADGYQPAAAGKGHARIVWDCSWMRGLDVFATASRDKTVRIWNVTTLQTTNHKAISTLKFEQAATAVDFSMASPDGRVLMAVGLENGEVHIFSSDDPNFSKWTLELRLPASMAHVDQVRALSWGPVAGGENRLASCGDDGSVRVVTVIG